MTSKNISESLRAQGIQARLTDAGAIAATAQNGDLSASQIAFLRENKPKIVAFLRALYDKPEQMAGRHYPPTAKIERIKAALEYFMIDLGMRFHECEGGARAEIPPGLVLSHDDIDALDDICLYHSAPAARARILETECEGLRFVSLKID